MSQRDLAISGAILLTVGAVLVQCSPGHAHQAPSGWTYDQSCCSNKDCAMLPKGAVQLTPQGYVVTVRPEDNKQLLETKVYEIPYKTTGIKISGDEMYHICLNTQHRVMTNEGDGVSGGSWLCFYIPPSGF